MRRAFTLIELLVIVAIMAVMVSMSIVSVRSGQDAARLRGATRDIFAAIRHARSLALVSKEPCVVTYSMEKVDEENCAKITVDGAKIINSDVVTEAQTLAGEKVRLEPEEEAPQETKIRSHTVNGESAVVSEDDSRGETAEEILFSEIAFEVLKGVCIKVVKDESELAAIMSDSRRAKPRISVFSNVDYLIGRHNEAKTKAKTDAGAGDEEDGTKPDADSGDLGQEPVKIVWEVNGRTEPHRIWVYLDGRDSDSGLSINVDRFGGMKVLGQDGEEIGK